MENIKIYRDFMKSNFAETDDIETDQEKKLPQPPIQKSVEEGARIIELPGVNETVLKNKDMYSILKSRRSRRKYLGERLTLQELSFLLWATQGVEKVVANGYATLRPVPSGGARHPFETYLVINMVEGIEKGVYRYLPLEHKLVFLFDEPNLPGKITDITMGQSFIGSGAVVFVWSCIPYRGEWRYSISAHKTMLLDAGHLCQNLYLGCEAIGCGTVAIGAYDQKKTDDFLKLDGEDEFSVYMAPVGKIE